MHAKINISISRNIYGRHSINIMGHGVTVTPPRADYKDMNADTEVCICRTHFLQSIEPFILPCSDLLSYNYPILHEEVEAAVKSLKKGKSAGADNVPAELVQARGEAMISALLTICNKIWQTGEWPTPWTESLIITLPKKGNLQLCQNYRTISLISLISHPSKVMLNILLNRLKPQAEKIIAEE